MKRFLRFMAVSALMPLMLGMGATDPAPRTKGDAADVSTKSIYDFTMKGIDGKDVSLKNYEGKVMVVVNVASQ